MLVVLSHTLRMEFTVQLFNRRSMYCVDMFPKNHVTGGRLIWAILGSGKPELGSGRLKRGLGTLGVFLRDT